MASSTTIAQAISITIVLLGAGANAGINLFVIPLLQSQPASRSLPMIRWVFSRGSHTMPTTGLIGAAGFTYLAYALLPPAQRSLTQLVSLTSNTAKVNAYIAAAALALSLGPLTQIMIPTNFSLIKLNEELGGFRSEKSAAINSSQSGAGERSAEESVGGKGEAPEFTDLSGPQSKTPRDATADQERMVQELLVKFKWLNWSRILVMTASGVLGLYNSV